MSDKPTQGQKDVSLLSDNELSAKVAELCPSLFVHVPSPFGPGSIHWRTGKDDNGKEVSPGAHINILDDLNAMHEAEEVFVTHAEPHQIRYKYALTDVVLSGLEKNLDWGLLHATARQRAEAFVLTMTGSESSVPSGG